MVIALGFLNACSQPDSSEELFRQYQQALATLNQTQATTPPKTRFAAMPRSSDMRQEIDRISMGLLDSMQLDKCRAGELIAQRNSALGKMQSPSARLRYELDSLTALAECRQSSVADDKRINDLLADAIEHKQETLPHYIDRALATGDELRHALRPATRMLPRQQDNHTAAIAALGYVTETLSTALSKATAATNIERYNSQFQTLAQSEFFPQYWRTQIRVEAWMQILNQAIAAFNQSPDCNADWQEARQIFKDELQPLLAKWQNYRAQITPQVESLHALSKQPEWQVYLNQLIELGEQSSEQAREHSDAWQNIKARCAS